MGTTLVNLISTQVHVTYDHLRRDAICKSRGSVRDGTGVSDSIVNQLLSKIDGVDSLNNILVIGMTNRKDMIDEAILATGSAWSSTPRIACRREGPAADSRYKDGLDAEGRKAPERCRGCSTRTRGTHEELLRR